MLRSHANLAGVIGRVISDSRTALKRVQVSSVFRLSKAITKHSKYGLTVLVLPSCLVKTDLTIHLDIPRNPGPKRAGNAAGRYPNNRLQNLHSRSLNLIKYSRSELSLLTSRHPISDDIFRKIKSMNIYCEPEEVDLVTLFEIARITSLLGQETEILLSKDEC